jgi:hypothetical protein
VRESAPPLRNCGARTIQEARWRPKEVNNRTKGQCPFTNWTWHCRHGRRHSGLLKLLMSVWSARPTTALMVDAQFVRRADAVGPHRRSLAAAGPPARRVRCPAAAPVPRPTGDERPAAVVPRENSRTLPDRPTCRMATAIRSTGSCAATRAGPAPPVRQKQDGVSLIRRDIERPIAGRSALRSCHRNDHQQNVLVPVTSTARRERRSASGKVSMT